MPLRDDNHSTPSECTTVGGPSIQGGEKSNKTDKSTAQSASPVSLPPTTSSGLSKFFKKLRRAISSHFSSTVPSPFRGQVEPRSSGRVPTQEEDNSRIVAAWQYRSERDLKEDETGPSLSQKGGNNE